MEGGIFRHDEHLCRRVDLQRFVGLGDELFQRVGGISEHGPAADLGLIAGEIIACGEEDMCIREAGERCISQGEAAVVRIHDGLSDEEVEESGLRQPCTTFGDGGDGGHLPASLLRERYRSFAACSGIHIKK